VTGTGIAGADPDRRRRGMHEVATGPSLRTAVAATAAAACVLAAAACSATPRESPAQPAAAPAVASPSGTAPDAPSPTPGPTPTPAPGLAAVAGDEHAGLTGQLLQFRRDVAARRLQVRLVAANTGLVVEGLELRAPGLPISSALNGEAALRQQPGLDLPVVMGAADCTVQPAPPVVELRLRDDTGARRTVVVPLDDGGLVRRLHDQDCADQLLQGEADIRVVDVVPVPTAKGPALRVSIQLSRIAGTDPVRVTGTSSNTVYDIDPVGPLPTLGTGTAVLVVDAVPARCDAHALGESYRTGLIDLVLAVGDAAPRPYVLTPADDVRHRLETFAVETCRAPAD
jgi:hypothetical protein